MAYIGRKMSERAMEAYDRGLLNKSMINKKTLKRFGINLPVAFVKWLINEGYLIHSEWHHTGRDFQTTFFYDMNVMKEKITFLDIEHLYRVYNRGVENTYPENPIE